MYCLIYVLFLSATTCKCKEQDVVLTTTRTCYNVNDNMTLVAEYKGSTTVDGVLWTITRCSSSMIILVPTCSPFRIPPGFPSGRMSYDCSSAPKYRLTVQTLESADFGKTWGADFSLSTGSTSSGTQQQTVTKCETVNERNIGFQRWTIGLISLAIVLVALMIYYFYRYKQYKQRLKVNEGIAGFPRWAIGLIVLTICVVVSIVIYGVYSHPQCLKVTESNTGFQLLAVGLLVLGICVVAAIIYGINRHQHCLNVNESKTGFPWWEIGLTVLAICMVVAIVIYGVYSHPQCTKVTERIAGFPRWAIGLIVLAICVVVAIVIYVVYSHPQCLKDLLNKRSNLSSIEENDDIRPRKKISPSDEERVHVTYEAKKDIGQEIGSNPLDEERMPFTNKPNIDIGQEIGSNEVKTSSKIKYSFKARQQIQSKDSGFCEEKEEEEKEVSTSLDLTNSKKNKKR